MRRPWQIWLAFAGCLILAVVALSWLSAKALQADLRDEAAKHQAVLEENSRLALWRMDSFMGPLLAQENARPYFTYSSFYSAQRAYGRMLNLKGEPDTPLPSPLLTQASPYILLHFQFDPSEQLTSPEVPGGKAISQAVPNYLSDEQLRDNRKVFAGLEKSLDLAKLELQLPPVEPATTLLTIAPPQISANAFSINAPANAVQPNYAANGSEANQQPTLPPNSQNELQQQASQPSPKAQMDFQARQRSVAQNAGQNFNLNNDVTNPTGANMSEVQMSMMTPLWLGNDLVLARRVQVGNKQYVQGCLLNWLAVKQELLNGVRSDLLPTAELQPVAESAPSSDLRRLASLPVQLIPGTIPDTAGAPWSPIRQSLLMAWLAMGLAAVAVAALLQGVISLSERRAAFVSAVTHELRTPLTTFRMYAEMLSEGMLPKEADRRHYLDTLRIEADRLTHLVANVLAYARLERCRPGGRIESIPVARLLEVATQRLAERATQAKLQLSIEQDDGVLTARVQADPAAVEQILFNLVDNACKYASNATDRRLHLSAAADNGRIWIRLRDHGGGVSPAEQRRLFQPFRKSARDAAHSAPGVGLGLALSQRLARDMQGDLRYEPTVDGACFALSLPMAD
jgi:signal transduction histidine kinase